MAKLLSRTFKSLKPHSNSALTLRPRRSPIKSLQNPSQILPPSSSNKPSSSVSRSSPRNSWAVYLILSNNPPIKTYVGVTNNFSRRCILYPYQDYEDIMGFLCLKQHNGELKGGAKASRAGRPWICACLIQGFRNRSKACEFESKWKSCSTKLPRKRNSKNQEQEDNSHLLLLQHRFAALNQVKDLIDCSHLEIDWLIDPM